MNFRTLKNKLNNRFYPKTPEMHFYYCNDGVPWLNEAKCRIFRCTVIFKKIQIHLYLFVCHLPAVRPGSATCTGPIFLTKNVIYVYNTKFHTLIQIFGILLKMAPSYLQGLFKNSIVMLLVILDAISIVCMFHKCELIMADNRYISEDPYYGITYLHHCILLAP